jgi:hypothetical protein
MVVVRLGSEAVITAVVGVVVVEEDEGEEDDAALLDFPKRRSKYR